MSLRTSLRAALTLSIAFSAPIATATAQWDGIPNVYKYHGCSDFGCHTMSLMIGRVADPIVIGTGTQDVWWGLSWTVANEFRGPVDGWHAAPYRYGISGPAIVSPDFDIDVFNAGPCWQQLWAMHRGAWTCNDTPYGPTAPVAHVPAGMAAPDFGLITLELLRPFDGTEALSDWRTWRLDRMDPSVVTTPEPASLALVGGGVLLLVAFARRRRRA